MDALYWTIPISLFLIGIIISIIIWAVNSGQFDDLEGPAHKILDDTNELIKKQETPHDNF